MGRREYPGEWMIAGAICAVALGGCADLQVRDEGLRFVIEDRVVHRISPGLFGHFLERPSWGETGIEAAVAPGTDRLDSRVRALLRELRPRILRFPGGTDVDYLDWRDMVDGVPGRGSGRPISIGHLGHPVTNAFGYDEFLRLCEELGAEPLLVVNLGEALLGTRGVAEAALSAAALVAYANAPLGAKLPPGMDDWPGLRARNGREKPYAVRYVQIGNEAQFLLRRLHERQAAEPERQYVEALAAYTAAIRAVDPTIAVVVDAVSEPVADLIRARLGGEVQYLAQHHYMPWRMESVERDGRVVTPAELSREELWYAWVAIPGTFNERGESVIDGPALRGGRRGGYKTAVTEWNWNGFWKLRDGAPPFESSFARAVGAAGYLHAFMRAGDAIEIACLSIAVGHDWKIASIRVDPSGREPPYLRPTGRLLMFYAQYHGETRVGTSAPELPAYAQPLHLGSIRAQPRVALVDGLATRSRHALYFHAINRNYADSADATLDLRAYRGRLGRAMLHVFEGKLEEAPGLGEPREAAWITDRRLEVEDDVVRVSLPRRSVSVVEVELLR